MNVCETPYTFRAHRFFHVLERNERISPHTHKETNLGCPYLIEKKKLCRNHFSPYLVCVWLRRIKYNPQELCIVIRWCVEPRWKSKIQQRWKGERRREGKEGGFEKTPARDAVRKNATEALQRRRLTDSLRAGRRRLTRVVGRAAAATTINCKYTHRKKHPAGGSAVGWLHFCTWNRPDSTGNKKFHLRI